MRKAERVFRCGIAAALLLLVVPMLAAAAEPPRFEVDPFWPKKLPNEWILGQVGGVAVDGAR